MAYCKINKENYFHNLSKVKQKVDKNKIAVVVKNNAYGHGLEQISRLAFEFGVRHAIVINIQEAQKISHLFETVLVLQEIPEEKISDNIYININSIESIKNIPENTNVELEVDTGMNRNGINVEELDHALNLIIEFKLKLNGVFTHFSSANIDDNSLNEQKEKFDAIRQKIQKDVRFSENLRFHCSASSALFRIDNNEYDLVRIGIMSYGYISLPKSFRPPKLEPVLSLWAEKVATRTVNKHDTVGYGRKFVAKSKMKISTYDIGYGDGLLRLDGEKDVRIHDGRKFLGTTSMNSFSISGEDDKVCVFEDASTLANFHHTIVYEIFSRINPNFKRLITG